MRGLIAVGLALLLAGCAGLPAGPVGLVLQDGLPPPDGLLPPAGPVVAPPLYAGLGVAELARRTYGEGTLRAVEPLGATDAFTRSLVAYDSDGLAVYGFLNVPAGEGPFPVVIVIHGYVDPGVYNTLTYTTRYADALARAGFLAIHPNLRGYPPSDEGPNRLRVGFAADVLNLIAHVQEQGGQPGVLEAADPERIGLWGHSMGGGIAQRVLVVDGTRSGGAVDAVLLYGSMSGDELLNHERIRDVFSGGARGNWDEGDAPTAAELARINPIAHLDAVGAPVSIHHGTLDADVPPEWSERLCSLLQDAQKTVECFVYEGQPHTFSGDGDALFVQRMVDFFTHTLGE